MALGFLIIVRDLKIARSINFQNNFAKKLPSVELMSKFCLKRSIEYLYYFFEQ